MRIQYTNPYRTAQTFLLRTDRPDLLRFEVRAIILSGLSLGVPVKANCTCAGGKAGDSAGSGAAYVLAL